MRKEVWFGLSIMAAVVIMVFVLMLVRGERMSLRGGAWRPGMLVGVLFDLGS